MVDLIQQNLSTAKDRFDAIRHKHSVAKHELDTAEQKLLIVCGKHTDAINKSTTKLKDAAEDNSFTTELELLASELRLSATEINFATAELKLATSDFVHIDTELKLAATELNDCATQLDLAATTYDLAIDCLRLSMHFFYPIQQCAQQVYHSAVPLSPTSSHLHGSCLQSVTDNKLSHVAAFTGAPSDWGSLLRTIDFRPRQLTCITTSVHGVISAFENIVGVYGVVTGVLKQSLCAPEPVAKIQHSPDGSILFLVHSSSVTMWDMQTGGHIHTFSMQSKISDIAVLQLPLHVALLMVLSHSGASSPVRGLNGFGVVIQL